MQWMSKARQRTVPSRLLLSSLDGFGSDGHHGGCGYFADLSRHYFRFLSSDHGGDTVRVGLVLSLRKRRWWREFTKPKPMTKMIAMLRTFLLLLVTLVVAATAQGVVVETTSPGSGPPVTKDNRYKSMVTLYIEEDDKRTPSGWSTRQEDGAAADSPFEFQPGVNLIQGWTEGVLQMKVGERALLHVPSEKGYGARSTGSPGGAFYIPANSDLLFDIEILGTVGEPDL